MTSRCIIPHSSKSCDCCDSIFAILLIPAFLPFNLLKAGLNAGFIFLLYKPITTALRRTGYLSDPATEQKKKPVGLWLFFGAVIITCILLILSMNGVV
ncbi:MAG: hypothetical protein NC121_11345 [Blautia sp.]|nr:hypothetical protein [Blautia sp.]